MRSKPQETMVISQLVVWLARNTESSQEYYDGAFEAVSSAVAFVWEEEMAESRSRLREMVDASRAAMATVTNAPIYGAAYDPQQPPPRTKIVKE